jgi:hypothetical protein
VVQVHEGGERGRGKMRVADTHSVALMSVRIRDSAACSSSRELCTDSSRPCLSCSSRVCASSESSNACARGGGGGGREGRRVIRLQGGGGGHA